MKTFKEALLSTSVQPVGLGWKLPIANGRFILTPEYDIVDTMLNNTKYIRDRTIPLATAAVSIPGLTTAPTNIAYLYALAVKPLKGLTDADLQNNTGALPTFLNDGLSKTEFAAEDVLWVVPANTGYEYDTDKIYIPLFSKYYMHKTTFAIHHVSDNSLVVAGTNRGRMVVLENDFGDLVEVDTAHVSLYAHGKLTTGDVMPPVFFTDLDATNIDPANVVTSIPSVTNATVNVADNTTDHVVQPGDGQPG